MSAHPVAHPLGNEDTTSSASKGRILAEIQQIGTDCRLVEEVMTKLLSITLENRNTLVEPRLKRRVGKRHYLGC